MSVIVLVLLLAISNVSRSGAHSWVACTDYRVKNPYQSPQGPAETDPARRVYDDSKCFGYPRDWNEWKGACFACDRGYNHQPGLGSACKTPLGDSGDYTETYPAARYVPGQTVCVAHTVKNHVAAPCTNAYIPDHGQAFYVLETSNNGTLTVADFTSTPKLFDYDGVHETPSFDYKGFQNSPAFCDGPDKALATACFKLPSAIKTGRYTFLWFWAFNSDQDVYTTCWEADVGEPVITPTRAPTYAPATIPPSLSPPSVSPSGAPDTMAPTKAGDVSVWTKVTKIVVESKRGDNGTVIFRSRVI